MTTYVVCFICYALSSTLAILLNLLTWLSKDLQMFHINAKKENLSLVEIVAAILAAIFLFGIDFTIMAMFVKFDN